MITHQIVFANTHYAYKSVIYMITKEEKLFTNVMTEPSIHVQKFFYFHYPSRSVRETGNNTFCRTWFLRKESRK